MIISVSENHRGHPVEDITAQNLLPEHIRLTASSLVNFMSLYYQHINEVGLPNREISEITANHDIDIASDKYLTEIQKQIASAIPESRTLDKVRLYKIIFSYYKKRGSEDSVYTFFKIFFNEFVSLFYPKDRLLNTSGERSVSSDIYRLQDGNYWQDFSYVIKSENNSSEWINEYLRFVHPAGLKLFTAILIIAFSRNNWERPLEELLYDTGNPETYWQNIRWVELLDGSQGGYHTPKFQGGWQRDFNLKFLYKTLVQDNGSSALTNAWVIMLIQMVIQNANHRERVFREDYQGWLKFLDPMQFENGYVQNTILEGVANYVPTNAARFQSLSGYVRDYTFIEQLLEDWLFDDEDIASLLTTPSFFYSENTPESIYVVSDFDFSWDPLISAHFMYDPADTGNIVLDGSNIREWESSSKNGPYAIEGLALVQTDLDLQPELDGALVRFNDSLVVDPEIFDFNLPLVQTGWLVHGTDYGTFAYKIDPTVQSDLYIESQDTFDMNSRATSWNLDPLGEMWGALLLPTFVYPWQLETERTRLITAGSLAVTTGDFTNLFRDRVDILSFRKFGASTVTNFNSCWKDCTDMVTFGSKVFDAWNPPTVGSGCFLDTWVGCTSLNVQSVSRILDSIDTSEKLAPAVDPQISIDYDTSTGSLPFSIIATRDILASKGWAPLVNGAPIPGTSMPLYVQTGSYVGTGSGTFSVPTEFAPRAAMIWGPTQGTNPTFLARFKIDTMAAADSYRWGGSSSGLLYTDSKFVFNGDAFECTLEYNSAGKVYHYLVLGGPGCATGSYVGNGIDNTDITGVGLHPDLVLISGKPSGGSFGPMFKISSHGRNDANTRCSNFHTTGNATNNIQKLITGGFQLGSGVDTNESGITYHYFAIQKSGNESAFAEGKFTGDSTDNRNIADVGFQPTYVATRSNFSLVGTHRSVEVGDLSSGFGSNNAGANLIQSFLPTGFQVGTSSTVNQSGYTHYWYAFKDSYPT